jgi:transposase-like protein/IS1 family transposase
MTCIRCQHGTTKRFGTYGKRRIQRYRCKSCKATFAAPQTNSLPGHYTTPEKAAQILSMMLEGMSVRAISRLTGAHKGTILSLMHTAASKCRALFDRMVRNIKPRFVQADELWSFVHTKEGRLYGDAPKEWGDAYTWVALDSESKLILSFHVGKRDAASAFEFVRDLSERIAPHRFQITTDGLRSYVDAIEQYFGADVDYAMLLKVYGKAEGEAPDWYAPTKVVDAVPIPVSGQPKLEFISTSHVERQNLSVRMHLRRFTRLTNAFSKKLENLKAAVTLYFAWYNFCRVHQSLRVTPAMQAGLTDNVWTLEELLAAA